MEITAQFLATIGRIEEVSSILEVICRATGMGFAAVARVTDTQWITCAVRDEVGFGLVPGAELALETTLCNEIRQHHRAVVIDHVDQDSVYSTHHTPRLYGLQSYISFPIFTKGGIFFGTLCAIDSKPATLKNTHIEKMFQLFSGIIASHLETIQQLQLTESKLTEQQKEAELRELFIAILGHDLRNPITAIMNACYLSLRQPIDESLKRMFRTIHQSSHRMNGLVENLLDFTRSRLGGGMSLHLDTTISIQQTLGQVIDEFSLISPNCIIQQEFHLTDQQIIVHDSTRIAQLLSNLLGNAISHGTLDGPIGVYAGSTAAGFVLKVSNVGKRIPDETLHHLFKPFVKGDRGTGVQQGLGLGLYISSEIAHAHNGTLVAESTDDITTFIFMMPVNPTVNIT